MEPVSDLDTARLNALGREGWELVAIAPDSSKAVFKRPGPDFRERITLAQRSQAEDQRENER